MSDATVDLDRAVEEAWRAFRAALADALGALEPGGSLLVGFDAGDGPDIAVPYVQARHVGDAIALDVSGNTLLSPGHKLSRKGQRHLRGLGLAATTKESPTYSATYPLSHVDEAASVAVSAFRNAFGVVHPAFLLSDEVVVQKGSPRPMADVRPAPSAVDPVSHEHLDQLIDRALTPMLGQAPRRDDDGDVPVCAGSAVVFIRNLWPSRCVEVFAELVVDVARTDVAIHELAALNYDVDEVKFTLHGDHVVASIDVAAAPFVAQHLQHAVERLCDVASSHDAALAERVGGRVFIDQRAGTAHEPAADDDEEPPIHPVMLRMLHLDAERPGSVGPATAAKLCGYDSDLLLELIRWNEEQEIAWREARDEASAADEDDEADACEHERAHAERTITVLRKALRRVLLG